jgi:hypothetical protein
MTCSNRYCSDIAANFSGMIVKYIGMVLCT